MITNPNLYDFVFKERDDLNRQLENDDKLLTNMLLLVSTGAFGLSVNFFINKGQLIHCVTILIISWVFLALSIFFNALGYYLASKAKEKRYEFFNERIVSGEDFTEKDYNQSLKEFKQSKIEIFIDYLNDFTFISFSVGIMSLTIFSILQVL